MLLILLVLVLLFTILGVAYYKRQQKANRIGGSISRAKVYWLAYALFNYLALPIFLLLALAPETPGYLGVLVFACLIYTRAVIQAVMMYGLLNWKPPYGIVSNLLIAVVMIFFLVSVFFSYELDGISHYILLLFLLKLTAILLCDSYYAFVFYRIVGQGTIGDQAVWFASSNDSRFDLINRMTYRFNIFFTIVTVIFLAMIIIAYG
jgi:hypothetical protein